MARVTIEQPQSTQRKHLGEQAVALLGAGGAEPFGVHLGHPSADREPVDLGDRDSTEGRKDARPQQVDPRGDRFR